MYYCKQQKEKLFFDFFLQQTRNDRVEKEFDLPPKKEQKNRRKEKFDERSLIEIEMFWWIFQMNSPFLIVFFFGWRHLVGIWWHVCLQKYTYWWSHLVNLFFVHFLAYIFNNKRSGTYWEICQASFCLRIFLASRSFKICQILEERFRKFGAKTCEYADVELGRKINPLNVILGKFWMLELFSKTSTSYANFARKIDEWSQFLRTFLF